MHCLLSASRRCRRLFALFFFFNDTATTEIYTLSLHDALPISQQGQPQGPDDPQLEPLLCQPRRDGVDQLARSEEHTSELQSRLHLVCRLLLEKKKKTDHEIMTDRPASATAGRSQRAVHHAGPL